MFEILSFEILTAVVKACTKGSIQRISYFTNMPVVAKYKNAGVHVLKLVDESVRFGVSYKNIKEVKDTAPSEDNRRTNNYEWVDYNYFLYNTNTDAYYLQVAHVNKNAHKKVRYYVYSNPNDSKTGALVPGFVTEDIDDIKDYIRPFYFKPSESSNHAIIKRININHIIRVNNTGCRYI